MTTRTTSLAALAVLSFALLTGCSFAAPAAATVDADDVANAAEDWLDDDEDVKYKVDCGDDDVKLEEDESVDCVATDRDTDLEYDAEVTLTNVDGEDFEVDVDRDSDATNEDDSDDDSDSDDSGDDTDTDDVFSLIVGDCFNDATTGLDGDDPVDSVEIVDCDDSHEREVYDSLDLEGDDDDYPGTESVTDDADTYCKDAFAGFVGIDYDDSELFFLTFYPTEDSWSSGDREVLCLISEYDDNDDVVAVTGSLEGAQR